MASKMTRKISISVDTDSSSPREFDNLGTISTWHGRYKLGDEQPKIAGPKYLQALPEGSVVLPVYMYDHSGLALSTTPFSCQFDSGQLGLIWASPDKIKESYGDLSPASLDQAKASMESEISTYNDFLSGRVYGYEISEDDEVVDSCWGFIGGNVFSNGISDHMSASDLPLLLEAASRAGLDATAEQAALWLAETQNSELEQSTEPAPSGPRPSPRC
jgi:hypothetical protein